ncbi:hypothetical protein ACIQZO_04700 [Streptomyces sp. NPDC097617]|uniref:hypothetical protein n=1 Tax=Streptomyces sp. NPDC097617 TaxID=3366091 RepID=UPI003818CD18
MATQRTKIAVRPSAGAVATVLAAAGWWLHQVSLVLDGKAPVSCGEAIRFLETAHPPETARNKQCTWGQWQTTWYTMDFQASRTEAEAWLHTTYPDARVYRDCVDADLCSSPTVLQDGDDSADHLSVDIRFQEHDSAVAHVSGVTTN